MLSLNAVLNITSKNPNPFVLGASKVGSAYLGEEIDHEEIIDKRTLISLKTNIMSRDSVDAPNWGIISNSGDIVFADTMAHFSGFANLGLLKEGLPIEIYLNNSLKKTKNLVYVFYSKRWSYDNDNKTINLYFGDRLEEWQDIVIEPMDVDISNIKSKSAKEIYDWLKNKTPKKYSVNDFSLLDAKTQEVMIKTVIPTPVIRQGNLWEQWCKLCTCCGLYVFVDKNNNVTCRYMEGA